MVGNCVYLSNLYFSMGNCQEGKCTENSAHEMYNVDSYWKFTLLQEVLYIFIYITFYRLYYSNHQYCK